MTESADSGSGDGADQIAMTDDLFGWPGDGVHWACVAAAAPRHAADPPPTATGHRAGWASVPGGGVLRRRLDEDVALLAVYLDVPLGDVENRYG